MGYFIVMGIAVVVVAALLVFARLQKNEEKAYEERKAARVNDRYSTNYDPEPMPAFIFKLAAGAVVAVALLFTGLNSQAVISPQKIGVELAFGKTVGFMQNGFNWKAPWASVTSFDETVQTTTYEGKNCLTVRIAESQTACVDVSVQWKILPKGVDFLFRNYNKGDLMSNITNALVKRRLEVNLSSVFGNYNPITEATSSVPLGQPGNPTVTQLASQVYGQLKNDVGSWINVRDVLIPRVLFDPSVQSRLNTILAQTAQTAVAQQAVKTALAQAQANKALIQSLSNDPNVLVQNCLNLVNEAIKAGYQLPPGFSCFGSSSVGVIASSGH